MFQSSQWILLVLLATALAACTTAPRHADVSHSSASAPATFELPPSPSSSQADQVRNAAPPSSILTLKGALNLAIEPNPKFAKFEANCEAARASSEIPHGAAEALN